MLYFRTGFKKGSCGRVARQSSAKAPTAVRIRSGPRKKGIIGKVIPFFNGKKKRPVQGVK